MGYVFEKRPDAPGWRKVYSSRRFKQFSSAKDACTNRAMKMLGISVPHRRKRPIQRTGLIDYEPIKPEGDRHARDSLIRLSTEIDRLRTEIEEQLKCVELLQEQHQWLRSIKKERTCNYRDFQSGWFPYRGGHWQRTIKSWARQTNLMLFPEDIVRFQEHLNQWKETHAANSKTILGRIRNWLSEPEPVFQARDSNALKGVLEDSIRTARDTIKQIQIELNRRVEDRKQCNYILIRRRLSDEERKQLWIRDGKRGVTGNPPVNRSA